MNDEIGMAHMQQVSNTTFAPDRFGNPSEALNLNGGFTQVPSGFYFNTPQFSITVWVYPRQVGSSARIIDFGNGDPQDNIIITLYPSFAVIQGNAWPTYPTSSVQLVMEQWQFLVCTYDGSTLSIYINGSLTISQPYSIVMSDSLLRVNNYVGKSCDPPNGYSFSYLDELMFFNVSLTQKQIENLMMHTSNTCTQASTTTAASTTKSQTTAAPGNT